MRCHRAESIGAVGPVSGHCGSASVQAGQSGIELQRTACVRARGAYGSAEPSPTPRIGEGAHLLTPERIRCKQAITSKKQALEFAAALLADGTGRRPSRSVFNALNARERLGNTGLDNGIAVSHARMKGLETPIAACVTLAAPIDFDGPDLRHVDILFCVLLPPEWARGQMRVLVESLASPALGQALRAQLDAAGVWACLRQACVDPTRVTGYRALQSDGHSGGASRFRKPTIDCSAGCLDPGTSTRQVA